MGPAAQVLTRIKHLYVVQGLEAGSYVFKLKAWGVEVGSVELQVGGGLLSEAEGLKAAWLLIALGSLLLVVPAAASRRPLR